MSNLFSRRWVGGRVGRVEDGRSQGDYNLHNTFIIVIIVIIVIFVIIILVIFVIMVVLFI